MKREDLRKVKWVISNNSKDDSRESIYEYGYFHQWIIDKNTYPYEGEFIDVYALVEDKEGRIAIVYYEDMQFEIKKMTEEERILERF